ncbi:MAG: energy-coupling factor transporter ATPase [Defluviitaleaceae bacterium]|nr:energy-coupling factor transporter ATPase [Defluviitaleaceae bacterium]MCL2835689.1 energy-coupling factor transporter ATPase [Defluviitaleaceae bacterium]
MLHTKLEINNLVFTYNKGASFEKKALDNVNLKIGAGEFMGLIGCTGSGKSTLIQQFNALLKPESGNVLLDGTDIHADKSRLKEVRRKVGLVFQYPEQQLFEETVAKDVAFGPKNLGLPAEEIEERVKWALDMVGLTPEMGEQSPFDLSGGQKRRAAIAGVLAMKPEVLVLDEPAAGLDPVGRDEILMKIREMHKRTGITIILVSHSMEDVARLVERIAVINGGRIVMDDIPAAVFSRAPELEQMGLSAPQAALLAQELQKRGFRLRDGLYTVEDVVAAVAQELSVNKGLNHK